MLALTTGSGDDQVTFATTTPGGQSWYAGAGNDTAVVDFSAFGSGVTANYYYGMTSLSDCTQGSAGGSQFDMIPGLFRVENVTLYGASGNDNLNR